MKMLKSPLSPKDHADHLIMKGKAAQEKRAKQAEKKKEDMPEDATFKPKILKKSQKIQSEGSKWEQLYKLGEKKKSRADKQTDALQYEKDPDQYTFQPNAWKKKKMRPLSPSPKRVPGYMMPLKSTVQSQRQKKRETSA